MRETMQVELKEKLTKTFLKTVSAYANYGQGEIYFGIKDDGTVLGVQQADDLCLRIEHMINDSLSPRPDFMVDLVEREGKDIVRLTVFEGLDKPYFYSNRAYRRSGTASTPIDSQEMRRLALSNPQLDYDLLPSAASELSFTVLEKALQKELDIRILTDDILKTLGLIRNNRYTIAGELFADQNDNLRSGIQMIRFGENISIFLDRQAMSQVSLLLQFEAALKMFDKWYSPYEEVIDYKRVEKIQIPKNAFREAVANALVHRRYDLNAAVQLAMYEDRIEITSPGGLPEGMSEQAYLYGQESLLRNMTIAEVFHRLNLIEKFGTGIGRIKQEYACYEESPSFDIQADRLQMILPVIGKGYGLKKVSLESQILDLLGQYPSLSRSELELETTYGKSRVNQALLKLRQEQKVKLVGSGRNSRYQLL